VLFLAISQFLQPAFRSLWGLQKVQLPSIAAGCRCWLPILRLLLLGLHLDPYFAAYARLHDKMASAPRTGM